MKIKAICLSLLFCLGGQMYGQQPKNREEVEFNNINKSTVIFTFGQSNSANYGQLTKPHKAKNEVYNYFNGKLFKAQDPLLGATGNKASVWGYVGDKLIDQEICDAVTIVPIGVGGVTVGAWCKGGSCYKTLVKTLDQLAAAHVKIDCICWHQGESDNIINTPTGTYIERFESIREEFRKRGFNAPFIVAVASYHPLCLDEDNGCSKDIRNAQIELAKKHEDIFRGPDTDKLNKCYQRADGIHFSEKGQPQHADLWVKVIKKVLKKTK